MSQYLLDATDQAAIAATGSRGSSILLALNAAVLTNEQSVQTPAHLLQKRTALFCLRIALAMAIITGTSILMLTASPLLFVLGIIIQGAMYVHLIELQHSVLHQQVFHSHKVNRVVGFFLGLPMLISYSDFQYRHLRHHKFLGTELNSETFSYTHTRLNSIAGFLRGMFDYSRCITFARRLVSAFAGRAISDGLNPRMEERIQQEYRLFGVLLGSAVCLSVILANPWPLIVWLAPLLAAEPVHFLLELPEHFGLPAHTNPSVFENTRSWGGSWFAHWYTHYTNFHVAHHFNQLVPMDNLPELQKLLEPHIPQSSRSKSYPHFYAQVITGEVRPYIGN